jgi:ribonucleoside-diphosphate reductase alpha chain
MDHVRMQAALQKHVDTSISKTVNCPEDIPFEDFKEVYIEAYKTGCKGCTTYRPNAITGSVLSVEPAKKDEPPLLAENKITDRDQVLDGKTYKLKWAGIPHAFYVTINNTAQGQPFEIFINTQNVESQSWITALTRMISAVFRHGGDVSFVPQELMNIHDPKGGAWVDGEFVPSLMAAIGRIVAKHMDQTIGTGETCSDCGENAVIYTGGCYTCTSCGHSKCG